MTTITPVLVPICKLPVHTTYAVKVKVLATVAKGKPILLVTWAALAQVR